MPRRRRSRSAIYRHIRLVRRTQRRLKTRRFLLIGLLVVFGLPLMAAPALAAGSVGTLPAVEGLSSSGFNQDTLIFDRNGILLDDIGLAGDHRIVVPLKEMSPFVKLATIAIEDRTFYQNSGVDLGGIARAAIADYTHHHISQGGSTISQQLVKQVFIGPNPAPTIQRKLREAVLAVNLNSSYSKDQILEMYLNTIYYGSQSYGIESSARTYFSYDGARPDPRAGCHAGGVTAGTHPEQPVAQPQPGEAPAARGAERHAGPEDDHAGAGAGGGQ